MTAEHLSEQCIRFAKECLANSKRQRLAGQDKLATMELNNAAFWRMRAKRILKKAYDL